MPIEVKCPDCATTTYFDDEFSGKSVECPFCHKKTRIQIPPEAVDSGELEDDYRAFKHDKLVMDKKFLSIAIKLTISDEEGNPVLYAEKPTYFFRSCLVLASASITGLLVTGLGVSIAILKFGESNGAMVLLTAIGSMVAGLIAGLLIIRSQYKKRHISLYTDASKTKLLYTILQDKVLMLLSVRYTLTDADGGVLAKFQHNFPGDFIRGWWRIIMPDGKLAAYAKSGTTGLAMPIRIRIHSGDRKEVIGKFTGRVNMRGRSLLETYPGLERYLDKRAAVAFAVIFGISC